MTGNQRTIGGRPQRPTSYKDTNTTANVIVTTQQLRAHTQYNNKHMPAAALAVAYVRIFFVETQEIEIRHGNCF